MDFKEKYTMTPGEKDKNGKDKIVLGAESYAQIEMLDAIMKQIEKNRMDLIK